MGACQSDCRCWNLPLGSQWSVPCHRNLVVICRRLSSLSSLDTRFLTPIDTCSGLYTEVARCSGLRLPSCPVCTGLGIHECVDCNQDRQIRDIVVSWQRVGHTRLAKERPGFKPKCRICRDETYSTRKGQCFKTPDFDRIAHLRLVHASDGSHPMYNLFRSSQLCHLPQTVVSQLRVRLTDTSGCRYEGWR